MQISCDACANRCVLYVRLCTGWGLDVANLQEQVTSAQRAGLCVRGLVVINPGNPTGQCLNKANQEGIVQLCEQHNLVLIADEVYQVNAQMQ